MRISLFLMFGLLLLAPPAFAKRPPDPPLTDVSKNTIVDPALLSAKDHADIERIEKYLDGLDPTQKIDWRDPANNVDHLSSAVLTGDASK